MSAIKPPKKNDLEIHKPYPSAVRSVIIDDFPSHFARYFFGVLTLIILYFSYLLVKPFLVEIFLALVLFIISKPLYHCFSEAFPWPARPQFGADLYFAGYRYCHAAADAGQHNCRASLRYL